jgi:hypothetical protein
MSDAAGPMIIPVIHVVCSFCGNEPGDPSYSLFHWGEEDGQTEAIDVFCDLQCLRAWLIGELSKEVSDE